MSRIASSQARESAGISVRTRARGGALRRCLRGLIGAAVFCAAGAAVAQEWTFETGTLAGWSGGGPAFDNQPTFGDNIAARRPGETSGHVGNWWIGTFENRPGSGHPAGAARGDEPRGTLMSEAFIVRQRYLHFLVGGGADITGVRIELLVEIRPWETPPPMRADGVGGRTRLPDDDDYTVRFSAAGNDAETMRRVVWDVRGDIGRKARIFLVDNSSGPWGHINVDDIRFSDTPPPITAVPAGPARYRLTATGFRVVRQSYDNIFQADGRDDEVYVRGDVFHFDRTGALRPAAVEARTLTIGNRQPLLGGSGRPGWFDTDRDIGGFVTGDTYPTATPWLPRSGPRANDLPLAIWEGELSAGENGVVIVPTIWEWDGPGESVEEQQWRGELLSAVAADPGAIIGRIQSWPAATPPVLEDIYSLRIRDRGTRPIGSSRPEDVRMAADAILLTFESAQTLANQVFLEPGTATPLPQGVLPLDLIDSHGMRGHYRLYLRLERLP